MVSGYCLMINDNCWHKEMLLPGCQLFKFPPHLQHLGKVTRPSLAGPAYHLCSMTLLQFTPIWMCCTSAFDSFGSNNQYVLPNSSVEHSLWCHLDWVLHCILWQLLGMLVLVGHYQMPLTFPTFLCCISRLLFHHRIQLSSNRMHALLCMPEY